MEVAMVLKDLKRLINSAKPFTDISRESTSKITLFFDREKGVCTAYSCDGYALCVESAELVKIDESFYVQVGTNLPYGDDGGYVYITKKDEVATLKTFECEVTYLQYEGEPLKYKDLIPDMNEEGRVHIGVSASLLKKVLKTIPNSEGILLEFNKDNKKAPIMLRMTDNKARLLLPIRVSEDTIDTYYNK